MTFHRLDFISSKQMRMTPQLNESQLNYLRLLLTLRSSDPLPSAPRQPSAQFGLYPNVAQKLVFIA